MNKKTVLSVAGVVLALAWAPWVPWIELRKALEPWNALITIFATAISPLIAVQVTRLIDSQRRESDEKMRIFRTLMEFRNGRMLSVEYARALSLIDVVFSGSSPHEKAIRDAFGKHVDTLTASTPNDQQLSTLHELLYLISESLDLNISRQAISKHGVFPAWVGDQLQASFENNKIQKEMAAIYYKLFNQPQQSEMPAPSADVRPTEPVQGTELPARSPDVSN